MSCLSWAFKYILSPSVKIWSTVQVFHWLTSHEFAYNKAEKLMKRHCLPLEMSENISKPWWILPETNKVAFDMIDLWKKSTYLTWKCRVQRSQRERTSRESKKRGLRTHNWKNVRWSIYTACPEDHRPPVHPNILNWTRYIFSPDLTRTK